MFERLHIYRNKFKFIHRETAFDFSLTSVFREVAFCFERVEIGETAECEIFQTRIYLKVFTRLFNVETRRTQYVEQDRESQRYLREFVISSLLYSF